MPLALTKTIRGTQYNFHAVVELICFNTVLRCVVIKVMLYRSIDDFQDGFLPIAQRVQVIKVDAVVDVADANYYNNPDEVVTAVQSYLIANVPFFSGGIVV